MKRYVFVESNTTGTGAIALRMLRARGEDVTFVTRDRSRYPFLDGVRVIDVDTNDFSSLFSCVSQLAPDAVVTFSTFYVATVAALAARLGLRFLNERTAATCHDKIAARRALHAAGLPNPSFWEVTSPADAARVSYPCVMKPPADSGSNGVLLIANEREFLDHYARLTSAATNDRGQTASSSVLVESLLDGPECSVESFTLDGVTHIIGVTRKHLSAPPHFVELGHDFPATLTPALETCVRRALEVVGYDFGPAHTEVRLTSRGPVIVEINPRLAGGMIPELVRLSTGIDLISAYLHALVGGSPPFTSTHQRTASIRFLVAPHAGTLQAVPRYDDLLALPGVDAIEVTARIGTAVSLPRSAYDRLGYVIAGTSKLADSVARVIAGRLMVV